MLRALLAGLYHPDHRHRQGDAVLPFAQALTACPETAAFYARLRTALAEIDKEEALKDYGDEPEMEEQVVIKRTIKLDLDQWEILQKGLSAARCSNSSLVIYAKLYSGESLADVYSRWGAEIEYASDLLHEAYAAARVEELCK
jgi:hypothetical protein